MISIICGSAITIHCWVENVKQVCESAFILHVKKEAGIWLLEFNSLSKLASI